MRRYIFTTLLLALLLPFIGCSDYLDKQPLDQFAETAVWRDPELMETFVNNLYYEIQHGYRGKIGNMCITDEGTRYNDRGAIDVVNSIISPSSLSVFGQVGQKRLMWEHLYKQIRGCNLFLEQVKKNSYEDMAKVDRLTGEIYFLRAHFYHHLALMYGGVPVIDKTYGLQDDPYVTRDPFEKVIEFIAKDCDNAAKLLPLKHEAANLGRATIGAALTLKARILLYAASDLFHDKSWAPGFSNPELIGYVGADRKKLWSDAKNAAKAVMDLGVYSLYKGTPGETDDLAKNFGEIFLVKETSEDIFIRSFTSISMETSESYHPGLHNGSNGYHCHGSNNPTGQLVDAFFMKDGSKFDWNNPTHQASPYENRDPRFYASILYDKALWRQRPVDVRGMDPIGIMDCAYHQQADGKFVGGLDTRNSPIEDWNGSSTNYYRKKGIDPAYDGQYQVQESPWRHMRYAEVLLSYAEACNELGEDDEARRTLNMIRTRVGLSKVTEGGDDLRNAIRHERRVELCFEDQRFYDIRRWMIAPQVIVPAEGIRIEYSYPDKKATYKKIIAQNRKWDNKVYLMPIRLDEMNKNHLLIQNPGY